MKIIVNRDEQVCAWVDMRLKQKPARNRRAIGIWDEDEEKLIAGIVYGGFMEGACQMGIAADSPRWCTQGTLGVLFAYPFRTCRLRRVNAIIARRNKRARKLVEGLGFKLEGKIREHYPDDDGMLYGMLASECRWLNGYGAIDEQSV